MTHQYSRAEHILTSPFNPSDETFQSSAAKGKEKAAEDETRLVDMSVTCRYLAAQCQVCFLTRSFVGGC